MTAVGSWALSCCGLWPTVGQASELAHQRGGGARVFTHQLSLSHWWRAFPRGPSLPGILACSSYRGRLEIQSQAPPVGNPGAEGGYGKATNCHCSSHPLKVPLTDCCPGPTENTPTVGEFRVDCAMWGSSLLENPSLD